MGSPGRAYSRKKVRELIAGYGSVGEAARAAGVCRGTMGAVNAGARCWSTTRIKLDAALAALKNGKPKNGKPKKKPTVSSADVVVGDLIRNVSGTGSGTTKPIQEVVAKNEHFLTTVYLEGKKKGKRNRVFCDHFDASSQWIRVEAPEPEVPKVNGNGAHAAAELRGSVRDLRAEIEDVATNVEALASLSLRSRIDKIDRRLDGVAQAVANTLEIVNKTAERIESLAEAWSS